MQAVLMRERNQEPAPDMLYEPATRNRARSKRRNTTTLALVIRPRSIPSSFWELQLVERDDAGCGPCSDRVARRRAVVGVYARHGASVIATRFRGPFRDHITSELGDRSVGIHRSNDRIDDGYILCI